MAIRKIDKDTLGITPDTPEEQVVTKAEILRSKANIITKRAAYLESVAAMDVEIAEYNAQLEMF